MPLAKPGAPTALLARMRAHTAAVLDADRRASAARSMRVSSGADRRIAVTGAVRRPALFLWDEGVTCADALAIAGGPRSAACRAVILRRLDDGAIEIPLSLAAAASVPLRPGDEVRVVE
jgi:protein involved in polysaccharide export with SLBB domain